MKLKSVRVPKMKTGKPRGIKMPKSVKVPGVPAAPKAVNLDEPVAPDPMMTGGSGFSTKGKAGF